MYSSPQVLATLDSSAVLADALGQQCSVATGFSIKC